MKAKLLANLKIGCAIYNCMSANLNTSKKKRELDFHLTL